TVTPAAADHLGFVQQPTTSVAGVAITPSITVQLLDPFGNLDTSNSSNVTLALGANPGGSTLSGTLTVAANAGVAVFADISLDKTGTGYALTSSSAGLAGANSAAFDITPAAADHLAFFQQPSNAVAGAAIAPA